MKKGLAKFLALASAGVMSLSLFAGCNPTNGTKENLAGYVAVDINPSIELITDENGNILEVRAVNDDAQIVLSDLDLVGAEIGSAIEQIAQNAEETGFITSTNQDVSITVGGETEKGIKELKDRAEKAVKRGSSLAQIKADEIRVALEAELEKIKASNPELFADLTVEQLKVINSIMEYDRNFTLEQGATMTMKELITLLKDYIDEHEDFIDDALEFEFDKKFDELSESIFAQIDAIFDNYNPEFSVKQDLLRELKLLEDKFERELEKAHADIAGHKFHFERDLDDEGEEVEVDEILTDEMKAELTALIGENVIANLDELDDYIDALEEEVEAILDSIDLNEIEKQIISTLKEQLETIKLQAKEALRGEFDRVREQFREKKQELKQLHGQHAQPGQGGPHGQHSQSCSNNAPTSTETPSTSTSESEVTSNSDVA